MRVMAERSVAESEERFRLIANSAPVPMWVSKLDGTRGFANQAYLDFLGLPYEEAIVFDWRKILHPDDLTRIVKESIAGEASLKPFVLEGRYRRADGAWRWMRSKSQPRWDPRRENISASSAWRTISPRPSKPRTNCAASTKRWNSASPSAPRSSNPAKRNCAPSWRPATSTRRCSISTATCVYANKIALSGIRADRGRGDRQAVLECAVVCRDAGCSAQTISNAVAAVKRGESVRAEMLLHLPAGDRYFDFAMRPVLDRHGFVTGILPEAVDITERRRAEEALRQSQKMEAVGQLTGGVAHDFNNLLTIIRSATDFLRRRDLPEDRRRRYVDAISDTVDRGSKLTGQLLAFARRQPLTPQVIDVGVQVEAIAQLIRPLVGSPNPDRPRYFRSGLFRDRRRRAIRDHPDQPRGQQPRRDERRRHHFDPASPRPMRYRLPRTDERRDGRFIAVAVTDTGVGIAPDQLGAIFEPFYTTKEVGKGTGLGLSQAVGFAKQSGGEIVVASVLGEGSTFTIYLPEAETPPGRKSATEAKFEPGQRRPRPPHPAGGRQ